MAAMGGKGFLAAHFRIPDERSVKYEKTQRTSACTAGQWPI